MQTFIHIENPCDENWENMHPDSDGRFCDLCTKKVIDFTQKSDTEILEFLQNTNGERICGHFNPSQLNRPLHKEPLENIDFVPIHKRNFLFTKVAASVLLTAGLGSNLYAQGTLKVTKENSKIFQTQNSENVNENEKEIPENKMIVIKGKLMYEDKSPVADRELSLLTLSKRFSTKTNNKGEYQLEIPESYISKKNLLYFDFAELERPYAIITRTDLQKENVFSFKKNWSVDGMMSYSSRNFDPSVYIDGEELDYEEYRKNYSSYKNFKRYNFDKSITKEVFDIENEDGIILGYPK